MLKDQYWKYEQKNESVQDIWEKIFFLSPEEWEQVREKEEFEFVIIGSGFCGFAFAERALRNDPWCRILIIERGSFLLPDHFQNLPYPYGEILCALPETFPWTVSPEMSATQDLNWQRGISPFFGGRSTIWSGWCPRPTVEELEGWPPQVIDRLNRYFAEAEKLLGIVSAGEIRSRTKNSPRSGHPIYGELQDSLTEALRDGAAKIPSIQRTMAAPLAVGGDADRHGTEFRKFSTPSAWLALQRQQRQLAEQGKGSPLKIITHCMAEKILQFQGEATALRTSRGTLPLRNAKLVLAMSTVPSTTLIMNSFPEIKNAGERYSAHFISSLVARVPREDFLFANLLGDPELAAVYVAGMDDNIKKQYHIQLTAISDKVPLQNVEVMNRYMPDSLATASFEQLRTSTSHILFVCAQVGELDHCNAQNCLKLDENSDDPTANVILQAALNSRDRVLWNTMEEATFQMLEQVLSPQGRERVEYWHANGTSVSWEHKRPSREQMRGSALFHEASTLWIGNEDYSSVVGLDYRPHGVKNVFITGGALWPSAGSWNPTLSMVGLAQHLADTHTLTQAGSATDLHAKAVVA
jgi:choline dehydrogenase-like flavoprotein